MNFIPRFLRRRLEHRPQLIKIIDNMSWLIIDNIFRMGFGFFVSIWIARQLGPDRFGELNYSLAYAGIFLTLSGLGLENVVVRNLVRTPAEEIEILSTTAVMLAVSGVVFAGFCVVSLPVFGLGDSSSRELIWIATLPLLFRPMDVAFMAMTAQLQMKYAVWIRSATFFLFSVIKILILLKGVSTHAVAWVMSCETILAAVWTFILYLYRGGRLSWVSFSIGLAKSTLVKALPLLLSGLSIMIYWRIDQIMLGEMVGHDQVGLYSAAVKLSEVWYFIPSALISSLVPTIIKAKMSDAKLHELRLQGLCAFVIWLSVGAAVVFTITAPFFVPLLLGSTYSGVTPILLVHIWSSMFAFLGAISMQWYLNENRERVFLYRTAAGAVINIALNFILLPRFGGLGAAYATVISYSFVALFLDAFSRDTRPLFFIKLKAFNPLSAMGSIRQAWKSR